MKEKSKGGAREGAGRKPTADPKQPVTIFVETSIINAYGGKDGIQLLCYSAIEADKANASRVQGEIDFPDHEKKFPPSDREIKQRVPKEEKRPIVTDLTKPTNVLQPQEQPKANYSINTKPKTLDELKALCPKELTGIDRSMWISTERQKYGI